MSYCKHCGVTLDEFAFGPHSPECPVTKRGRTFAESVYRRIIECTPAVAADVLALAFRDARRSFVALERAACLAIVRAQAPNGRTCCDQAARIFLDDAVRAIEEREAAP